MVDAAGSCQYHPRTLVVRADVVDQVIARDGLDVLGRAQDRPSERGALPIQRTRVADPDPHSNCGSGSTREKITHKNRKKYRIFMF